MKYNIPDRVLRDVLRFAKKHDVERIILFGSRARGTNTERSDIDVVNLNEPISAELQDELTREGIIIYEKDG